MDTARIAELLEPYLGAANGQRLTTNDLENISIYIDLLQRWNARINLTAIRDEEEIVTRHFGESLFAARHLFPGKGKVDSARGRAALSGPRSGVREEESLAPEPASSETPSESLTAGSAAERRKSAAHGASRGLSAQKKKITLVDIGSGAGFPGIPIKLWAPEISLTLIESNHKKTTFLRETVRSLTLTDINIKNDRAEALTGETFDVVALRAVERFDSILPVASSLVAPRGRLVLLIGSGQLPSARSALPSFAWQPAAAIPGSESRVVAIADSPE